MDSQICKNCVHFLQHYVIDDQSYTAIHCGHCTRPRLKNRRPLDNACEHFVQRTEPAPHPDRKSVVNFLTKEVLQHILDLPLPPEQK